MRIKDTGKSLEIRPDIDACLEHSLCREPVVLEISNERNALERTMLHFACYKKRTEKLGDSGKYLCRIYYSRDVETELLIQILLRTSGKGSGAGKLSETGEGTGGEAAAAVCERLQ